MKGSLSNTTLSSNWGLRAHLTYSSSTETLETQHYPRRPTCTCVVWSKWIDRLIFHFEMHISSQTRPRCAHNIIIAISPTSVTFLSSALTLPSGISGAREIGDFPCKHSKQVKLFVKTSTPCFPFANSGLVLFDRHHIRQYLPWTHNYQPMIESSSH